MADDILVPTSPGELVDKLTILQLKTERIADVAKLISAARKLGSREVTTSATS